MRSHKKETVPVQKNDVKNGAKAKKEDELQIKRRNVIYATPIFTSQS